MGRQYPCTIDNLESAIERLDFLFRRHMFQLEEKQMEVLRKPRRGFVLLKKRIHTDSNASSAELKSVESQASDEEKATDEVNAISDSAISDGKISLATIKKIIEDTPIVVFLRVAFVHVWKVDTNKGHYIARVLVEARWLDPKLHRNLKKDSPPSDWSKIWNPQMYFANLLPKAKVQIRRSMKYESSGSAVVFEKRDVIGRFTIDVNNDRYPFETQELIVTIRSHLPATKVVIEQDTVVSSDILAPLHLPEWKLHNYLIIRQGMTTDLYAVEPSKMSLMSVVCTASHRPMFLLLNAFVAMTGVCALSFMTWNIDQTRTGVRVVACVMLLLAIIMFKRLIDQTMPETRTPTFVDAYMLVSIVVVLKCTFWHAMVGLLAPNIQESADNVFFYVTLVAYCLFVMITFSFIAFHYFCAPVPRGNDAEEMTEEFEGSDSRTQIVSPLWAREPSFS